MLLNENLSPYEGYVEDGAEKAVKYKRPYGNGSPERWHSGVKVPLSELFYTRCEKSLIYYDRDVFVAPLDVAVYGERCALCWPEDRRQEAAPRVRKVSP